MRSGVLATIGLLLALALSGCKKQRDIAKPSHPAVQLVIPYAPGWAPGNNDSNIYVRFNGLLQERLQSAPGVVKDVKRATRNDTCIVTIYTDHPDQILTIAMPFLKNARLPKGTTITKYEGEGGLQEEPIPFGA